MVGKMALRKPLLGYGPGSSSIARGDVRTNGFNIERIEDKQSLQLHNLFGQVIGELGLVGGIIFFFIIYNYLKELNSIKKENVNSGIQIK